MALEGQKEADRQRMKTLLVEAIATLCRNGLQYEEDLCVEGLIGITVDKTDVFLVSVKETFSLKPEPEVKSDDEVSQEIETPSSRRGSKRSGNSTVHILFELFNLTSKLLHVQLKFYV